jgi:FKBP-type peptidyl-prolyl cis-trans isomerase
LICSINLGWEEGLLTFSLGEKAILHIRADYGYGEAGAGKLVSVI